MIAPVPVHCFSITYINAFSCSPCKKILCLVRDRNSNIRLRVTCCLQINFIGRHVASPLATSQMHGNYVSCQSGRHNQRIFLNKTMFHFKCRPSKVYKTHTDNESFKNVRNGKTNLSLLHDQSVSAVMPNSDRRDTFVYPFMHTCVR